jgi:hypothetical protein
MFGALTAWVPTDHSREMAALVEETFRRLRMTRDQFADLAGLTIKQLSAQLCQQQPMNLWRLANVSGFRRMFAKVIAEQENLLCIEKELVLLTVEQKPMAKASLDAHPQSERRRTA